MSYFHMFFAVDLDQLQQLFGSNDESFVAEVLLQRQDELQENDEFFEDYDDDFPSSETLLREIIAGEIQEHDVGCVEASYGYVLKIICEHIGESVGDGVAAVSDHPYPSPLVHSGPPIPIPILLGDFPEIGFIPYDDIPQEIERTREAARTITSSAPIATPSDERRPKSFLASLLGLLGFSGAAAPRQSSHNEDMAASEDDLLDDINAYREALQEALDLKRSIVSFRH